MPAPPKAGAIHEDDSADRRKKTNRPKRSRMARVKNPTGRVDWLAFQCAERLAQRHEVAKMAFEEFKPEIETALSAFLGPRNKSMKDFRKYLTAGIRLMAANERRLHEAS